MDEDCLKKMDNSTHYHVKSYFSEVDSATPGRPICNWTTDVAPSIPELKTTLPPPIDKTSVKAIIGRTPNVKIASRVINVRSTRPVPSGEVDPTDSLFVGNIQRYLQQKPVDSNQENPTAGKSAADKQNAVF